MVYRSENSMVAWLPWQTVNVISPDSVALQPLFQTTLFNWDKLSAISWGSGPSGCSGTHDVIICN